jgi:hypothetical protein
MTNVHDIFTGGTRAVSPKKISLLKLDLPTLGNADAQGAVDTQITVLNLPQ